MDRINKFLETRQKKHIKTIKYKEEKFTITKEDLKTIRAYKSGKCLDPSLKSIPNRAISNEKQEAIIKEPKPIKIFKPKNRKRIKIEAPPKNEIIDIWEENNDLKEYKQEWIYSIETAYEGSVEKLRFDKEKLEEELKRIYLKQFRPRDIKQKSINDILPKVPEIETMRPFPEFYATNWEIEGKKIFFQSKVFSIKGKTVIFIDLKFNKILFKKEFEEEIIKAAYFEDKIIISSDFKIYKFSLFDSDKDCNNKNDSGNNKNDINNTNNNKNDINNDNKLIDTNNINNNNLIKSNRNIKNIYLDNSYIAYLTSNSIHIHNTSTLEELKILKLKGDSPHSIQILENSIYASTHKGIMIDSVERSEIKNLGYVIDFKIHNNSIYAINNVGRLLTVDNSLKIIGNTVQNDIGAQIEIHPLFNLIAIVFSNEICIYKIIENQSVPINTILGDFRGVSWDEEKPWLYASRKGVIELYT